MSRNTGRKGSIAFALVVSLMAVLLASWPAMAEAPVDGMAIDVNSASASELASLPGIGEAKAAAIVAHRDASGPFRRVEDLLAVRGLGEKILDQIRPLVKIGLP